MAYADLLKDIAKTLGWNGEKDAKGRKFLQKLGQVAREYNDNFWVEKMVEQVTKAEKLGLYYRPPDYIFVTDCRYLNEIEEMKKHFNCVTVRVIRPNFNNGLTVEQQNHPSETELDSYNKWDYIVINNGTLEQYGAKVRKICEEIVNGN